MTTDLNAIAAAAATRRDEANSTAIDKAVETHDAAFGDIILWASEAFQIPEEATPQVIRNLTLRMKAALAAAREADAIVSKGKEAKVVVKTAEKSDPDRKSPRNRGNRKPEGDEGSTDSSGKTAREKITDLASRRRRAAEAAAEKAEVDKASK